MNSGPQLTNSYSLRNKRVIVTGASRGLGRAIAIELSRAGAHLILVARNRSGLEETARILDAQPASIVTADLADHAAPAAILREARSKWERLDGLVNNAAILGPIGPFESTTRDPWEEVFRVNLFAPADLCRRSAPWMMDGGGGSIVNLSGGGATGPRPCFTAYGAAKAALVRLTETLAVEWAPHHIRLNALAPGAMNTEMLEEVLRAGAGSACAEHGKALEQKSAGGADPSVAARLCCYLLSDQSAAISGRLLSAVWDPWPELDRYAQQLAGSDIYTLRRIVPEDRRLDWSR